MAEILAIDRRITNKGCIGGNTNCMEAVLERCCSLDVRKRTLTACLLTGTLDG